MAREDIEVVRLGHDAFNRRDLDAYISLHDREVEFTTYERALEGLGPYRGHGGIRRWWQEALEVLPDLSVDLEEVRDLGDSILVQGRLRGHGAGSGAPFERTYWGLFRCRRSRIVWWHAFQTEAEALEAVAPRE